MTQRPFVFGVLGGIASGKSAVAQALAGPQGIVVDADREAHAVLEDPAVIAAVRTEFGEQVTVGDVVANIAERHGIDGSTHAAVISGLLNLSKVTFKLKLRTLIVREV